MAIRAVAVSGFILLSASLMAAGPPPTAGVLPSIVEYQIPTINSGALEVAMQGEYAWFTETRANKIGRISPTGDFLEFAIPTPNSEPTGIAVDPDGNVWFSEYAGNKLGKIGPDGAITEYPLEPETGPIALITPAGATSAIWYAGNFTFQVGHISSSGKVSQLSFPGRECRTSAPIALAAGPDQVWILGTDQSVWRTDTQMNITAELGYQSPPLTIPLKGEQLYVSDQFCDVYQIPQPAFAELYARTVPQTIALDSYGYLWFAKQAAGKTIRRVKLSGSTSEYSMPANRAATHFTAAIGGGAWFTEYFSGRVGRIDSRGNIAEYLLPSRMSGPVGIAEDEQGIWVVERSTNKIAHLTWPAAVRDRLMPSPPAFTENYGY